jgi:hypothetical protein
MSRLMLKDGLKQAFNMRQWCTGHYQLGWHPASPEVRDAAVAARLLHQAVLCTQAFAGLHVDDCIQQAPHLSLFGHAVCGRECKNLLR